MGIFKKISIIESKVKNIEGIISIDIPYYKSQMAKIDEIKAEKKALEKENKELKKIIKEYEKVSKKGKKASNIVKKKKNEK